MEKKKNFFSTEHFLSFNVKMPYIKSEVRRKDEDFDHLQKYLVKVYPNVIVPTTKAHKGNRYNEQKYITKRSYILQRFLREVLRSRLLRGDSYLMSFLTETDNKKYLKELERMNKQEKVTKLDDIITQDGKLVLTIPYVEEIRKVLQSKVRPSADQTEKAYIYLHKQMARLALDLSNAAHTIETIREAFESLSKTSYDLQNDTPEDVENQENIRFFYKVNKEAFAAWSVQMNAMSEHLKTSQTRFFENFASQGERLGQLKEDLSRLDHEHNQRLEALGKKQEQLFKTKNVNKWENPDAARLPKADQDELLRDPNNVKMIAVAEQ